MAKLPEPFASIPRFDLLYPGPTPIQKLERISRRYSSLDYKVTVWVKHEDTNSPLGGGGNKIRKLEYLVPEILSSNPKVDTLVTVGGIQSNHCRQVTALGARLGLEVVTVHSDLVPGRHPGYSHMGNMQLSKLMGGGPIMGNLDETMKTIRERGGTPYFIPSGASGHPLGGLGFARWAFELCEQEAEMGVFFDTIVVSVNSGSTVAGMVAGFKLMEREGKGSQPRDRKIICVDAASRPAQELEPTILKIAREAASKINVPADDITESDFIIEDRFTSGSYGVPNDDTLGAMREAASKEALILDPVYTGKAFTAVFGLLDRKEVADQGNILFCHTGGTDVLGAYPM